MPQIVINQDMVDYIRYTRAEQRKRTRALVIGWLLFLAGLYGLYSALWNWVHV